jgi:hypothetical protein
MAPGGQFQLSPDKGDDEVSNLHPFQFAQTAPRLQPDDDAQADRKHFSTRQAHLSLAGWALNQCDAEGHPAFIAVLWNMPRNLADLPAVERFADPLGA